MEAQGGASRAKYGDNLIKEWGEKLEEKYGKKYSRSNLFYMKQFYLEFPIVHAVSGQFTWIHMGRIMMKAI